MIASLASVFLISLISLIGLAALSLKKERLKAVTFFLVSLAAGALFGDAFFHLVPQSLEKGETLLASLLIVLGIIFFFILEKFLRWRHCHVVNGESHLHPMVTNNLIGDWVHNFIDGVIIAASYSTGSMLGIASTLAIILHEIPQELGDFGVLIHGGLPVKKALFFNFLSALAAVLGAVLFLIFGQRVTEMTSFALPMAAGGFIYIAGSDLIPELQHQVEAKKSLLQLLGIVIGLSLMFVLAFLEK